MSNLINSKKSPGTLMSPVGMVGEPDIEIVRALNFYHGLGGVNQNKDRSYELFKELAAQGNVDAMIELGCFYFKGECCIRSFSEALIWWQRPPPSRETLFAIGILYHFGDPQNGVMQNERKAINYWRRAANLKYLPAIVALYKYYPSGTTHPTSYSKFLYQKHSEPKYPNSILHTLLNFNEVIQESSLLPDKNDNESNKSRKMFKELHNIRVNMDRLDSNDRMNHLEKELKRTKKHCSEMDKKMDRVLRILSSGGDSNAGVWSPSLKHHRSLLKGRNDSIHNRPTNASSSTSPPPYMAPIPSSPGSSLHRNRSSKFFNQLTEAKKQHLVDTGIVKSPSGLTRTYTAGRLK